MPYHQSELMLLSPHIHITTKPFNKNQRQYKLPNWRSRHSILNPICIVEKEPETPFLVCWQSANINILSSFTLVQSDEGKIVFFALYQVYL